MKKLCFMLTALLLAVPAFGVVDVNCTADGDEVTVTYDATADGNLPRAFGIDITLSDGNIVAITYDDPNFWVHPGTISIVAGDVNDEGTPVGDPCDAPYPETQYGLGTGGMTIEMGSLYNDPCDPCHPDAPPLSGVLLKFTVDTSCDVNITGNAARGNVVLESTAEASVNYGTCSVTILNDCLKATAPGYLDWLGTPAGVAYSMPWSKPDCWCYPRQCRGDADGLPSFPGVPIWVDLADLNILRGAIGDYITGPGYVWPANSECANFDHQMSFPGVPIPVDLADLNVLRNYIGDYGTVPCCDTNGDCTIDPADPNYNFWTGSTTP